jgi:hypothetical protein
MVGMALCASSPLLVIWSRELKQYEIEGFFSVLLALLVFRVRRSKIRRKRWIYTAGMALVCLLGPWFGYGIIFVAAVLTGVLIFLPPISRTGQRLVITGLACSALLFISTFLVLCVSAAEQAGNEALLAYMKPWFIDFTSFRSLVRAGAYGALGTSLMIFPLHEWSVLIFPFTKLPLYLLAGIVGVGIWSLALFGLRGWPRKSRLEMACWVIGPWVLSLAAAVVQKYPFGPHRMMVFLATPLVLAVATGLVGLCRSWCIWITGRSGLGIVVALVMVLLPVFYMVGVPMENKCWVQHDFPAALGVLKEHRKSGELVYVGLDAVHSVRYYAGELGREFTFMPSSAGTLGVPHYDYDELSRDILRRAGRRLWLLTTSLKTDLKVQRFICIAQQQGYKIQLVAEAGGQKIYGVAQLYVVEK